MNDQNREGSTTHHEVRHIASKRKSSRTRPGDKKSWPKPSRRPVARNGLPHSEATARYWLRKGGVTQRLCRGLFEAAVARTHTLLLLHRGSPRSFVSSQVARRLPGHHCSVAAGPLPLPDRSFFWGASTSGRPPPAVHRWTFCTQALAWTRL